jgi:hypothetical protein
MRKDCVVLLLALFFSFFGGCSDDPTEPEDDPNAEYYVLQDNVLLIDISEQLNSGEIWWDFDTVLNEPGLFVDHLGQLLFWPTDKRKFLYYIPSEEYPDVDPLIPPLFVKFFRFETRHYAESRINTFETDLSEVFKECHIHRTIPLKLGEGDYELPDDTVELIDTGNLSLTKLVATNTKLGELGIGCGGGAKVDVTINRGTIEVNNPVLKLDIDISNGVLHQFSAVTQSRNKIDVDMSLDLDISGECSVTKEIFRLNPPKVFTVQAGPLPVVIAVDFNIVVGAAVGGGLEVNLGLDGVEADVTTWAGLVYNNKSGQPCVPESACYDRTVGQKVHSYSAATEPALEAEVQLYFEAFVKETVSATIYGAVGPEVWFKQYIKPSGTWPHEECEYDLCKAYVSVVAGLDVGGGLVVKFANKTIAKWEPHNFPPIEKTLWDDCIDIHIGPCP